MSEIGGIWRTVGGRRIFIKDGQSLSDAMIKSGKFPSAKKRGTLGLDQEKPTETEENFVEKINFEDAEAKIKEYEAQIIGKEIEYSYVINPDGNVYKYTGSEKNVDIKYEEGAIITHNHPIDDDVYRSFGADDYYFIKNGSFKQLRVANPDYTYIIEKIKPFEGISYNEIYMQASKKCFNDDSLEIHNETMLILKEKGFVKYERTNT